MRRKLILEQITSPQTKGRIVFQIDRWLEEYPWDWKWDLSPRGLLDGLALGSTARTILTAYEHRNGTRMSALLVLEPYPGVRTTFHLHSLIQAPDLDPHEFKAFSARWGQSRVDEYRRGGGFTRYLARKIAAGAAILDIYGTPKKEVENVQCN